MQPDHLPDIFFDIDWDIEQEPDVAAWLNELDSPQFGHVAFNINRLLITGSMLRMPHSRPLGDGLYELRFDHGTVSWRITYFFTEPRRIVLLTVFRKQRNNERHEVKRAHAAKARCIAEGHTADETDMTRTKWTEVRDARLATFNDDERMEYDRAYRAAALAASIGEQIRAFREEASLTQRELAERMGTSQAAIARLEAGGVGATVTTLQRIADTLGLALTVVLHRPAA